jgi:hypothetical protein
MPVHPSVAVGTPREWADFPAAGLRSDDQVLILDFCLARKRFRGRTQAASIAFQWECGVNGFANVGMINRSR